MGQEGKDRGSEYKGWNEAECILRCVPNTDSQRSRNRRKLLRVPPSDIRPLKMRRNGSKMGGDDGDITRCPECVNQAGMSSDTGRGADMGV